MINSAHELVPLNGIFKICRLLANHDHEIELLIIKASAMQWDYTKDYLDESLDFLFQTIRSKRMININKFISIRKN